MNAKFFLCILSCLLIFQLQTKAQCCAAGNPISIDAGNKGKAKSLLVGLQYKYSYSDTYYEESKKSSFEYKATSYDFIMATLGYGLTEKIDLKAEIGYFARKSETFVISDYQRYAKGFGDASITLNYLMIKNEISKYKLYTFFTLKMPVGEFDQVYNKVLLPIDLQPSSGSFRYKPGLRFQKNTNNRRFSYLASISAEFAEAINSERVENYKYGNLYLTSISGSYRLNKRLNASVGLLNQFREKAKNNNDAIHASGGEVLFLMPQLSYNVNGWRTSLITDIPVYKNLNDKGYPQLSNKFAFSISLSKTVDLKK